MAELDWDDLRFFLHAAEARTLAGAARRMGVEHTTIGRRLTALERSLGAPLVLRAPDGLRLTPLGEKIAPLVEDVARAVQAIADAAARRTERVRLAVPSGFTRVFAPHLPRLRREHPGLAVELLSGAQPVDLRKGEADIAVRVGPVTGDDLIVRKLCEAGWALYASESYLARRPPPEDPDDLSGHDVIAYDGAMAGVPAARWIEERAARANVVLRSREMVDMLNAALSGAGLAVLACHVADAEPTLRRLTPDVVARRNVLLVTRRDGRSREPVRAVCRFVVEVMRDQADAILGARR